MSLSIRALSLVASLFAVAALTGCPEEWAYESDFEMQIGRYDQGFQPYKEDALPLESGWQGGQHIPIALHAKGIEAEEDVLLATYAVAEGTEDIVVPRSEMQVWFEEGDAYWLEYPAPDGFVIYYGMTLFVEQPDEILGERLEVRVEAFTADSRVGRVWSAGIVDWDNLEENEDQLQ